MKYGGSVLEGFKPMSLAKFGGYSNPYELVASINMQIAIIGAPDSLECKLLSGTFHKVTLY